MFKLFGEKLLENKRITKHFQICSIEDRQILENSNRARP